MIGGLLYLTTSRPDIMQLFCLVARFQENLKVPHEQAINRIFIYLKGTMDYELWCKKGGDFMLKAYTNAYWARSVDD